MTRVAQSVLGMGTGQRRVHERSLASPQQVGSRAIRGTRGISEERRLVQEELTSVRRSLRFMSSLLCDREAPGAGPVTYVTRLAHRSHTPVVGVKRQYSGHVVRRTGHAGLVDHRGREAGVLGLLDLVVHVCGIRDLSPRQQRRSVSGMPPVGRFHQGRDWRGHCIVLRPNRENSW